MFDAIRHSLYNEAPRRKSMSFREIGDYIGDEVNRAIEQKMADLMRRVRAEETARQEVNIDMVKKVLKENPQVLLYLVKEACSDAEWVSGLLDFYFSQEPTPIFKEALKEALS
jgi:hypothetical protein